MGRNTRINERVAVTETAGIMKTRNKVIGWLILAGLVIALLANSAFSYKQGYKVHKGGKILVKDVATIEQAFNAIISDCGTGIESCNEYEAEYTLDKTGWGDSNYPVIYFKSKTAECSCGWE